MSFVVPTPCTFRKIRIGFFVANRGVHDKILKFFDLADLLLSGNRGRRAGMVVWAGAGMVVWWRVGMAVVWWSVYGSLQYVGRGRMKM